MQPLKKRPTRRKIIAYDLEWEPFTYRLRLVGVYDGRGYRQYPTVEAFFNAELTTTNDGAWFFAHNAGLADMRFLIGPLVRGGYESSLIISGSSLIMAKVTKGRYTWLFGDSLSLLKSKLADIGNAINLPKLEYDCGLPDCNHETCIFSAPMSTLIPYNKRDCEIVYRAVMRFQDDIVELGGELAITIASCGMKLFRKRFMKDELSCSDSINLLGERAYHGGRVEAFKPSIGVGRVYDINSSFPAAMLYKMPGIPYDTRSRLPNSIDPNKPFLADCDVLVPPCNIPPLCIRADIGGNESLFFPTGTLERLVLTPHDLIALELTGGKVLKCHECTLFTGESVWGEYALFMWEQRQKTKDPFHRLLFKYLLNCLYGKTGERELKEQWEIHPSRERIAVGDIKPFLPGLYQGERKVDVPHRIVPVGATITSRARFALLEYLLQSDPAYCDTDSIITQSTLPTGTGLGELKVEHEILSGEFLLPKLYKLETTVETIVRAKGFHRLTPCGFDTLKAGKAVQVVREPRIKSMLTSGNLDPSGEIATKQLTGETFPKRKVDGPWDIGELREALGKPKKRKKTR